MMPLIAVCTNIFKTKSVGDGRWVSERLELTGFLWAVYSYSVGEVHTPIAKQQVQTPSNDLQIRFLNVNKIG